MQKAAGGKQIRNSDPAGGVMSVGLGVFMIVAELGEERKEAGEAC